MCFKAPLLQVRVLDIKKKSLSSTHTISIMTRSPICEHIKQYVNSISINQSLESNIDQNIFISSLDIKCINNTIINNDLQLLIDNHLEGFDLDHLFICYSDGSLMKGNDFEFTKMGYRWLLVNHKHIH